MSKGTIRFAFLVALASAAGCLASCAQNVGDIDQTQADKTDVSIFTDGKPWWFLQTVVDVPPTTQFTFVGESSFPPDRIVWDVQQNWLIAYRNYEFVLGAQTYSTTLANGSNGAMPVDQQDYVGTSQSPYFGTPVAAYSILSHFDVERQYNPATGEQTNLIVENTTDRPWYERQYIRVDWSNNGFGGFNFLSAGMGVGGYDPTSTLVSPVAYYVDQAADPTNPDAPDITPSYIGIINKLSYQAEVDTNASQYYGQTIYKCFDYTALVGTGLGDCGPGEVKVRLSFEKIPDGHDFAPKVHNDQAEQLFGVWQQQRSVYDPQRGYLEPNLAANQFAVMHHIWQKDHFQADPADATGKTPCDPNNIDGAPECVMPLNVRAPKPIVYYTNSQWPAYGDAAHSTMWTHADLLARDYNDDMRGVVAAARRGGPSLKGDASACTPDGKGGLMAVGGGACPAVCTPADIQNQIQTPSSGACPYLTVADWMTYVNGGTPEKPGIATPDTSQIDYTNGGANDGKVDYSKAQGLDYLAYPPDTRYLDPSHYGYEGVRADETYVRAAGDANGVATGPGPVCNSADIAAGGCSVCNPAFQYCMGIGHVPYSVIPRMFVMCHNPVEPRVIQDSNGKVLVDKSDPTNPASYDFSQQGDPDICDARPDSQRSAQPLSPQMGDLRYHMLSWVQQPDDNSPGGIGEPAMDPVTGEIISAHAYIYARAVENLASYGADLVAVMEGWEPVSQFINGNLTEDYVLSQVNGYASPQNPVFPGGPPIGAPQLSPARLQQMFKSRAALDRVNRIQSEVASHLRDPGINDWTVANWQKVTSLPPPNDPVNHLVGFDLSQPVADEVVKGFLPTYAMNTGGSGQIPQGALQTVSFANQIAPPPVSTWNAQYVATRKAFDDRHILGDDEIEPTAVRLAKYYDQKFYTLNAQGQKVPAATNPCASLWQTPQPGDVNPIADQGVDGGVQAATQGSQYRTCVWEAARQEILGNLWRSYSDHEVGHTFGQYHNFAGSTDALNYFDPYWDIRQHNTVAVNAETAKNNPDIQSIASAFGVVNASGQATGTNLPVSSYPGDPNVGQSVALAPEWLQAPSEADLEAGLREYQYTSIMDYNAKFNSDFQGLGKYDHACHMFEYANQVEVFDKDQLPKVPANVDTVNHAHQVDDTLLVPFNRHYTIYPWLIADGTTRIPGAGESVAQPQTPLAVAVQKMIHARRWVSYVDLQGAGSLTDATTLPRDGLKAADLGGSLMVPYRFCSDLYNLGESHCLWFDEGADAFEQANGFIQEYQLNYLFNNFKRQNENFDIFDNAISYQERLWQRNFNILVTIYQQFFNDEFVVRLNSVQQDAKGDPEFMCPEPGNSSAANPQQHYIGYTCGMNQLAAGIDIADFFTKVLQTPTSDTFLLDQFQGTYCPSSYSLCATDGYSPSPGTTPIQLLPGSGAKYDLSQYSMDQYGMEFMYKPTVLGVWLDKIMAIDAMSDPDTYIVGELNSQPLSFLLSIDDLFGTDVEASIGGLLSDDPAWAPKIAVWTQNPADPNHPPITLYRNSRALQGTLPNPNPTGFPVVNPWCPANSNFCSTNDPPSVEFSQDPVALTTQTFPGCSTAPCYSIYTVDPGPVYFERLLAAYLGAVWLTSPIDNQNFIQAMHIGIKGSTYEAFQPEALSCQDGSQCTLAPAKCADGSPCTPGGACGDGSLCGPRYLAGGQDLGAGTCSNGTPCAGICDYQTNSNPTVATCDPQRYAEYTDPTKGTTYYATKFVPPFPDLTGNANYYSTGYQLVQLAAKQQGNASVGLGAADFLDILRGIYYYWSTDPSVNNWGNPPPGSPL
ncbi:MAG: hypothetical protein ACYDCL_14480 [Myxococcales bacterium]